MLKLIQKAVRKFFGENNGLYYWLVRFEYRWHPPLMNIEKMFDEYANVVKQVTFIQVGANDGKSGDPLFRYVTEKNWQGIMVEPVQFLFKQLLQTYARQQEKIFFVNAAIGKEKGKQIFYRLRRSSEINAPQWYDQLGSFNKEVLLKHKTDIPNIELLLIEEEVQTVTISELMQTYGYETVDCLHIDTEGYDYEIIKTFPFNLTKPGLILFEHKHLSVNDFKKCIQLLKRNGYLLYSFDWDTIAIHSKTLKQVPTLVSAGVQEFSIVETMNLFRYNKFTG